MAANKPQKFIDDLPEPGPAPRKRIPSLIFIGAGLVVLVVLIVFAY